MDSFNGINDNIELNIETEIDMNLFVETLSKSPRFIEALIGNQAFITTLVGNPTFVNAVRNIILADVRRMGNAFGKYAQASAPTATTNKKRIS